MGYNVLRVNTTDKRFRSFEKFSGSHPDSNFFQSGIFYRFIEGLDNYTPVLLICEDMTGSVKGSLLAVIQKDNNRFLRYFSAGIIIRGGPLIDIASDTAHVLADLLSHLIKFTEDHAPVIQFRNFTDRQGQLKIFEQFRFKFIEHQNLIIETGSVKDVLAGLSKSRKRQISKSIRNGVKIVDEPSPGEFHRFYQLLKELYRKKIHKPLPSWSFFQRFFDLCEDPTFGIVRLVKYHEEIIGGILCPVSSPAMIHEWYICGLDHQYKSQGVYPSVMATWAAMEYACNNNIGSFDFLGLGNPGKQYGVRDFKEKFGGTMVNYGRFERINNYPLYFVASKGYLILKFIYSLYSKIF